MSITPEQYKALLSRVNSKKPAAEQARESIEAFLSTPKYITFLVDPCPAPRQSRSDAWKPSPRVLRYRAWKDQMRPLCETFGWKLSDTLNVTFHIPMPKSWSKKKREQMNGKPHQQKPDVDNLAKGLMDLQGVDDGHVHSLAANKVWSEVGRIVVWL